MNFGKSGPKWIASAAALGLAVVAGMTPRICAAQNAPTITPEKPMAIDALLTTVNGEPIFVKDVIRPLDEDLKKIAEVATSLQNFQDRANAKLRDQLDASIQDILIYAAAKDGLAEEELKMIDRQMGAFEHDLLVKKGKGSRAQADAAYRAEGTTLDRVLLEERRQLTIFMFLRRELMPQISVRRRDVMEEYERNIAKYTIQAEVDLYLIRIDIARYLVKPGARGDMEKIAKPTPEEIKQATSMALGKAREIYDELKKGGDFAKLAAESDDPAGPKLGGRYPHLKQGSFYPKRPEVQKKAFEAPANSIVEPFMTLDSEKGDPATAAVFVLKVGNVVKGRVRTFEETQREIEETLRRRQDSQLRREYMGKLYEGAAIDNKKDRQIWLQICGDVATAKYWVR